LVESEELERESLKLTPSTEGLFADLRANNERWLTFSDRLLPDDSFSSVIVTAS